MRLKAFIKAPGVFYDMDTAEYNSSIARCYITNLGDIIRIGGPNNCYDVEYLIDVLRELQQHDEKEAVVSLIPNTVGGVGSPLIITGTSIRDDNGDLASYVIAPRVSSSDIDIITKSDPNVVEELASILSRYDVDDITLAIAKEKAKK